MEAKLKESDYYLGFSVFPGVGPKRFTELIDAFGTAEDAWHAHDEAIINVLKPAFGKAFLAFRKHFTIEKYVERLVEKKVQYVTLSDTDYPELLREISFPPFVLYLKGNRNVFHENEKYIGVVGTRKITSYGRQVTEMVTEELVSGGCVIVSGLALGVDTIAHQTTVGTGGKTVAVLGSGVDVCHPMSNKGLYEKIVASEGTIVSEYPLGEPPSKGSFPSRNRIIAGLSEGVVVTEGAHDSGALITAEDAFTFGRQVYAVPGPITSSLSKGPNSLLSRGAKLVTSGKDILDDLGIPASLKLRGASKSIKGETEEEQQIIDLLMNESLLFDEIVKRTGFDSSKTGIILSMMEMKGMIALVEAGEYSLST